MLRSLSLSTATLLLFTASPVLAQTQNIAIQFQGQVGNLDFTCGFSYTNLGADLATATPTDFRLYVANAALITTDGTLVPITLTQDGKWQHDVVALLDFENKTHGCANGTAEMNTQIVGTVPVGDYQGLTFSLGVPYDLNHEDATLAPSPLNLTSMWWNWRGGYKFLRVDLDVVAQDPQIPTEQPSPHHHHHSHSSSGQKSGAHLGHSGHSAHSGGHSAPRPVTPPATPQHHQPSGEPHSPHDHSHHGAGSGFLIHLGSTGCLVADGSQQPTSCQNPNQVTVTFPEFDPRQHTVIADLAALVFDNNLMTNAMNTPPGCMSGPEDGDCEPLFENLGITSSQMFFRRGDR